MLCFVMSGAANRVIGASEQRKEAFRVTVRQASKWAVLVGIVIGFGVGYIFVRRDPANPRELHITLGLGLVQWGSAS